MLDMLRERGRLDGREPSSDASDEAFGEPMLVYSLEDERCSRLEDTEGGCSEICSFSDKDNRPSS